MKCRKPLNTKQPYTKLLTQLSLAPKYNLFYRLLMLSLGQKLCVTSQRIALTNFTVLFVYIKRTSILQKLVQITANNVIKSGKTHAFKFVHYTGQVPSLLPNFLLQNTLFLVTTRKFVSSRLITYSFKHLTNNTPHQWSLPFCSATRPIIVSDWSLQEFP